MDVEVHWAGGFVSRHELTRPVARYEQLRDYERLRARIAELREARVSSRAIAERLNTEGWPRPSGRGRFTSGSVRNFFRTRGLACRRPRAEASQQNLGPHEWWCADLAHRAGVPARSIHTWIKRGYVNARQLDGHLGRWIVWADDEELGRLRRLHERRRGWSSEPPPTDLATPKAKTTTRES
jgi:hypothetical protein